MIKVRFSRISSTKCTNLSRGCHTTCFVFRDEQVHQSLCIYIIFSRISSAKGNNLSMGCRTILFFRDRQVHQVLMYLYFISCKYLPIYEILVLKLHIIIHNFKDNKIEIRIIGFICITTKHSQTNSLIFISWYQNLPTHTHTHAHTHTHTHTHIYIYIYISSIVTNPTYTNYTYMYTSYKDSLRPRGSYKRQ